MNPIDFDPTLSTVVRGPAPRPAVIENPSVRILGDLDPYGETQTDDAIRDGDVLVIPGVAVGVMVSAWPVLVNGHEGESGFHELSADADVRWLGQQGWGRGSWMRYFPVDGPDEGVPFYDYSPPRGGADYTASFDLANTSAVAALARLV